MAATKAKPKAKTSAKAKTKPKAKTTAKRPAARSKAKTAPRAQATSKTKKTGKTKTILIVVCVIALAAVIGFVALGGGGGGAVSGTYSRTNGEKFIFASDTWVYKNNEGREIAKGTYIWEPVEGPGADSYDYKGIIRGTTTEYYGQYSGDEGEIAEWERGSRDWSAQYKKDNRIWVTSIQRFPETFTSYRK